MAEPGVYLHNVSWLREAGTLTWSPGAVLLQGGKIVAVDPLPAELPPDVLRLNGRGGLLAPGFVDLQLNGAFGHDFTSHPASLWRVAAQLPQYGVTGFLPTIITSPLATIQAAQGVLLGERPANFLGAEPLGLHLEGPYLNPGAKGAHNPRYLREPESVEWSPADGVRLVTLAPELPGALPLIAGLVERGVLVSAGHTLATAEEAQAGIEAGIRYATHLFNAMSPLHHRRPGAAAALLADERVTVGLIVDGRHIHPLVVKLVWRLLGPQRLNLVSDAMAALGLPPGEYRLGDRPVMVHEDARLADGTLAGSLLSLEEAAYNLASFAGCTLAEAVATLSQVPAHLLGLSKGVIAPGYDADLVLLSPEQPAGQRVQLTIVAGRIVYAAPGLPGVPDNPAGRHRRGNS